MTVRLALFLLIILIGLVEQCLSIPGVCESTQYWATISNSLSGIQLAKALEVLVSGHNVIPYSGAWNAFLVLDGNGTGVFDIYAPDLYYPKSLQAKTNGYNREHLWCRSRGVSDIGPATSDLMALRPCGWSINSVRNNKWFGDCNDPSLPCKSPASAKAPQTATNSEQFLPPPGVRGSIARALFYMAIRYRSGWWLENTPGQITYGAHLILTNSTALLDITSDPQKGYMGMLPTLLQWHKNEPVTPAEVIRNNQVCEQFQGNRNPFVDHPEWVDLIPWDNIQPTAESTDEAESSEPMEETLGVINVGQLLLLSASVGLNRFELVNLIPLVPGQQFVVTDASWTGSSFFSSPNEGFLTFTVGAYGIPAGASIGWPTLSSPLLGSWSQDSSFLFDSSADQLFVFTGSNSSPSFIFGALLGTNTSAVWATSSAAVDERVSMLPTALIASPSSSTSLAMAGLHVAFTGQESTGTPVALRNTLLNSANWASSTTASTPLASSVSSFTVLSSTLLLNCYSAQQSTETLAAAQQEVTKEKNTVTGLAVALALVSVAFFAVLLLFVMAARRWRTQRSLTTHLTTKANL